MSRKQKKPGMKKRIFCAVVFALSAALILTSVLGFTLRTTKGTLGNLNEMRINAVLHAASDGLVESIAADAKGAKLKELRKLPNFRQMGMNEVEGQCQEAEDAARAEAESKYSGIMDGDTTKVIEKIAPLNSALEAYAAKEEAEQKVYAEISVKLYESVADWTDFAGENDDQVLSEKIISIVPEVKEAEHLLAGIIKDVRNIASEEKENDDEQMLNQLMAAVKGALINYEELRALDDDQLWGEMVNNVPELAEQEALKDTLITETRTYVENGANGVAEETEEAVEEISVEREVNYEYFVASSELDALDDQAKAAYNELFDELCVLIPDLSGLDKKMKNSIQATIENVVYSENLNFSERYGIYTDQKADSILQGSSKTTMWLAAYATQILIAGIALLLFALVNIFWRQLTKRFGVPRTIITLFFIYLCLAAELYNIYVPLMLSNVLVRVGMYGVLALAMLPGIQCGIGLNMGMTLGCIAGLLSTVIALQYDMTGFTALFFSCILGALIAIPLGWAYSLLLNRMKGNEMTISTYVGFSFVSLMCIGWMLIPFTNPKIIWLLSGRGLRVTHSLLGSFAHILDEFLAFEIFGIEIPTGLLLFFLACCLIMWLFSRSKVGIAMTAAGSNPRFAEASGINVNRMRTLGTVLSTIIAAVGIVIYSQAFGYAQLYTAPRQMGFIAASIILIGGATVSRAKVSHVIVGVFLFEGVLALGQQIANAAVAGGGLSEVMRIMISNGIILYALTQSGGGSRE